MISTMIKFVYFDVGGVVIKDFSNSNKWEEMLKGLGVNEQNRLEFEAWMNKYKDRICLDLDIDTKLDELRSMGYKLKPDYSMLADFVSRFEPNPAIWPVIETVKKRWGVGLLTDQFPRMFSMIGAVGLMPPVKWDVIIDSSVVGVKKPSKEIFELAQKQAQKFHPRRVFGGEPVHSGGEILMPEEILFVDNREENTEAAKKLGWQTWYYDSGDYEASSRRLAEFIGA